MAVSSQIQRRFAKYLPSDRTTRRHLAEMESLGFLGGVETNNVSPLFPKVYFVTSRGLARLRQAFHDQGQGWSETAHDRRRSDGVSAQHVLHEILTTELLLQTWDPSRLFTNPIWHRPYDALNAPTGRRWRIVSPLDVGC